MLFCLLSAAYAASLEELATGTFALTDSAAQVAARREAAIEATTEPMSFAMALLARGRLRDTLAVCQTYTIALEGERLTFGCDDKPPVTTVFGGEPTAYTSDSGQHLQVVSARRGEAIMEVTFTGDSGAQLTRFDFSSGRLVVTKTVTSDLLEVPLTATFHY